MNWLSSLSMATLIVCCPALTLLTAIVARLTVRALGPRGGGARHSRVVRHHAGGERTALSANAGALPFRSGVWASRAWSA